MVQFNNILVLKWGALGDFIAGTSAIRALREHFPQARITLFSNPNGLAICPAGSLVDAVLDRQTMRRELGWFGMLRYLRAQRFDLAVNLKWASEGAALLSYFSAPVTAGNGKFLWRRLYTYRPAPHAEGDYRHEYHKNLDIVEALGVPPAEAKPYLHIMAQDHAFAETFCVQHQLDTSRTLLITPGASRPGKMWPYERFAEIGRRFIRELGGKVIVSWVPQDEALARKVVELVGDGAYMCPRTTVGQIGAITSRSSLCLCNNSGIMHVAYAVGTPVICLNTAVSWAPYGDNSIAVNAFSAEHLHRKPELGDMSVQRRLVDIPVDEVWSRLVGRGMELMAKRNQGVSSNLSTLEGESI